MQRRLQFTLLPSPVKSEERHPLLGESEIKQIKEAEGLYLPKSSLHAGFARDAKSLGTLRFLVNLCVLERRYFKCMLRKLQQWRGDFFTHFPKLLVGIKVLSAYSIMGVSANGEIRGEILPEGLLRYLFTWRVTPQRRSIHSCVVRRFCLSHFLCVSPVYTTWETFSSLSQANIAPFCIASSKWDGVFDVQTSFEPPWETELKFVPLVNRGPRSQDPTGGPLLHSLPSRGREDVWENVICWLQMSAEEGAALLRNTVAPPCHSELF